MSLQVLSVVNPPGNDLYRLCQFEGAGSSMRFKSRLLLLREIDAILKFCNSTASAHALRTVRPSFFMSKHAAFSLHVSTAVHISAAIAALAWGSYQVELPHYHLRSGTISIEASFATPEPAKESTFEVALTPASTKAPVQPLEVSLQPLTMELRPQRKAIQTSLTRSDLPPELEECDCEAADHPLQTAKRQSTDEPQPVVREAEPEKIRREELAVMVVETAEVQLPSVESLGSDVDELARPLSNNRLPVYPGGSLAFGQQVQGIVQAKIGMDGNVEAVELVKSCGIPAADQSALAAIAKWQFQPARRGSQAVACSLNVPFRFRNL